MSVCHGTLRTCRPAKLSAVVYKNFMGCAVNLSTGIMNTPANC